MRDVDRHAGLPADYQGLLHTAFGVAPDAPDVGGVHPSVAGHHSGNGDQLLGGGMP